MKLLRFSSIYFLLVLTLLVGCENQRFGSREKGALGGAALGAGLGAIVGNQVGNPGAGVAIGSAFGALSGAIVGNEMDKQDAALEERERKLEAQDREIAQNKKLLAELRAKGIDARATDRGVVINLPDVLFAFDSAELTRSASGTVSDIAHALENQAPGRKLSIEGHADALGSVGYNQRLSENRAQSVARELSHDGIPRSRMNVRGYGERRPIASNETESGRQRNRRVEVIVENR